MPVRSSCDRSRWPASTSTQETLFILTSRYLHCSVLFDWKLECSRRFHNRLHTNPCVSIWSLISTQTSNEFHSMNTSFKAMCAETKILTTINFVLKPENVLVVDKSGNRIKLIDFGLARRIEKGKKLQVLFGTFEFVSMLNRVYKAKL